MKARSAYILIGLLLGGMVFGPFAVATDGTNGTSGPAMLDYDTDQLFDSQDPPHTIVFPDIGQTITLTGHGTATVTGGEICSRDGLYFEAPDTVTVTATDTGTYTATGTGTGTGTGTATGTDTRTADRYAITWTDTGTGTRTATWTITSGLTITGTGTATGTATITGTVTGTVTASSTATITGTGTSTNADVPSTCTRTGTSTFTATGTDDCGDPVNGCTVTTSCTGTGTFTATGTNTAELTATATSAGATSTETSTDTVTASCASIGVNPTIGQLEHTLQAQEPLGFITGTGTATGTATSAAMSGSPTIRIDTGRYLESTWTSDVDDDDADLLQEVPDLQFTVANSTTYFIDAFLNITWSSPYGGIATGYVAVSGTASMDAFMVTFESEPATAGGIEAAERKLPKEELTFGDAGAVAISESTVNAYHMNILRVTGAFTVGSSGAGTVLIKARGTVGESSSHRLIIKTLSRAELRPVVNP